MKGRNKVKEHTEIGVVRCGIVGGGRVVIHSNGQTICSFTHIESITLAAGD
jgi:hypothetical protein